MKCDRCEKMRDALKRVGEHWRVVRENIGRGTPNSLECMAAVLAINEEIE